MLGGLGRDTESNENLMTTAVIVVIDAVGVLKGLEMLEDWGLVVTFAVITMLI